MSNKLAMYAGTAGIIVVACIISGLSIFYAQGRRMFISVGAALRNTIEIPLSQADCLKADYGSKNLEVYVWQEDKIVIKEYLVDDSDDAKATVAFDGNKATVTGGRWQWSFGSLFWGSTNQRIEIYLPKSGINELELVTGSGNIRTKGEFAIETQKADIRAGSGNITWENTEAQVSSFNANSGNIRIDNIKGDISLGTGSGNITAEGISGSCAAQAGSGNIKVNAENVTGDIMLETGSGNQRLELPDKLSFSLEIHTGSGNIHTDYDETLSYNKKGHTATGQVGDNPAYRISLEAGSGNVTLKEQ